jgi:hypothetical protein
MDPHPRPLGAELLRKWAQRTGANLKAVGQAIGVSKAAMYAYAQGEYRPSDWQIVEGLERITDGAVPASAWLTDEERARIDGIKPLPTTPQPEAA